MTEDTKTRGPKLIVPAHLQARLNELSKTEVKKVARPVKPRVIPSGFPKLPKGRFYNPRLIPPGEYRISEVMAWLKRVLDAPRQPLTKVRLRPVVEQGE